MQFRALQAGAPFERTYAPFERAYLNIDLNIEQASAVEESTAPTSPSSPRPLRGLPTV